MDPTASLIELLRALRERDVLHAADCAQALCDWISGGGFLPRGLSAAITAVQTVNEDDDKKVTTLERANCAQCSKVCIYCLRGFLAAQKES